jgi:hypothetical protein
VVSNQYAADTVCKQVTVGVSSVGDTPFGENALKIYPNPTAGQLRWVGIQARQTKVRIFNPLGQILLERETTDNYLDITNLPDGFYFLEVIPAVGLRQVKQFVLHR